MTTQLPRLVEEIIDYYLQIHYLEKWRKNIIIMHEQYYSKVYLYGNDSKYYMQLEWICSDKKHTSRSHNIICELVGNSYSGIKQGRRDAIIHFAKPINNSSSLFELPKRYFYSSGLNAKAAYKKSHLQKIEYQPLYPTKYPYN